MIVRTLDVGNSRIKMAVFNNGLPIENHLDEAKNYINFISDIKPEPGDGFSFCSVDPGISSFIRKNRNSLGDHFYELNKSSFPLKNAYKTPHTLGADRMAAAFGAYAIYKTSSFNQVIVIDAGTALTCDIVDIVEGHYLGGVIMTGIAKLREVLKKNASSLNGIGEKDGRNVEFPARTSSEAIALGSYLQTCKVLENLILSYIEKHRDKKIAVVSTGGDIEMLDIKKSHRIEKDLIHIGLEKAFQTKIMGVR